MKTLPLLLLLTLAAPAPAAVVDFDHSHAQWNELLTTHVHPGGLVDYRGLSKRRVELSTYLAGLEAVTPKTFGAWKPEQREAFWINAYNAYTVRLILDNYPVESIKDLGGFFSSVWSKRFIPLQHLSAGHRKTLSLEEVEHEILGKTSRQPLFHFAIVCASKGCPELRAEAYQGGILDKQLADAGRRFLADKSKNAQRVEGGKLRISKIFDWSEEELATYPGGIRGILLEFGPETMKEGLRGKKPRYSYMSYDWSINEWIAPKRAR